MDYTTKESFTAIVTYTIAEERKSLREALRDNLIKTYGENPLDESTYGICATKEIDTLISEVAELCKEAETESTTTFEREDSVFFFHVVDKSTIRKRIIVPTIIELDYSESRNSIKNILNTGREQVTDTWRKAANKL